MPSVTKPTSRDTPSARITGPIETELNYIRPDAENPPEVFYSGGSSPQTYSDEYAFMPALIADCRANSDQFTIHENGFELADAPTAHHDFDDDEAIARTYYDEVSKIVRDVTGAKDVFVFDHTVRRGDHDSKRKPAHHVHNDYTETTALVRAEEMMGKRKFAKMAGRRMIQINVWRSLVDVVTRSPLTFCDASSIDRADLIPTKIHFPDTDHVGEIFALRKQEGQRWSYFSEMTHKEVVLIKGYDSETKGTARFTPHTAFEYPDQDPSVPARASIETRTFAFY